MLAQHYRHLGLHCPELLLCKSNKLLLGCRWGASLLIYRGENTFRGQLLITQPPDSLGCLRCIPSPPSIPRCFSSASKLPACRAVLISISLKGHFIKSSLWASKDIELLAENEDVKPHWILEILGSARHRVLGCLPAHGFILNGPG